MLSPLRKGRLTGSRIGVLMTGTASQVIELYHVVRGESVEEDLTWHWPAQLGLATEELNRRFYSHATGHIVTRVQEFVPHPSLPWAGVTLDGFVEALPGPLELKHVGGYEHVDVIVDRYQPQCQYQMECTGTELCALSLIFGGALPVIEILERDEDYVAEMLKRGEQFMRHVRDGTLPIELPPVEPPPLPWRELDMTGNNRWADLATTWLLTKPAADTCSETADALKAMIEPDVRKATGHGVLVRRDRAGRQSIRADDA